MSRGESCGVCFFGFLRGVSFVMLTSSICIVQLSLVVISAFIRGGLWRSVVIMRMIPMIESKFEMSFMGIYIVYRKVIKSIKDILFSR